MRERINILGISAFYHDSAACFIQEGKVIAAAQEERFSRIKHDSSFPSKAVEFCLDYSGVDIDQLDAVVFYDKPLLKFERLLETYYAFAPKGLSSFIASMPVWLKEKMFLKSLIKKELKNIQDYDKRSLKLLFPEHHLSHAASAFYTSPFEESAILTLDGVGEWATTSICKGKGNQITNIKEMHFPHSIGLLYSAVTYYLGFKVNSGEYKLMGLAPYGDPQSARTEKYCEVIKEYFVTINDDGSIYLNQSYFRYATGLKMVHDNRWQTLLGFPKRAPESEIQQHHCDLALAIQKVTEEIILKLAREAKRSSGNSKNLCLAGGVALNCVANGKLQSSGIFENIYIQPAAGDAGGAIGAALAAYHIYFEQQRVAMKPDGMNGSFLGPEYTFIDVEKTARKYNAVFEKFEDNNLLHKRVASLISEGNVVGWMSGRMEFGPRALGARSILGDPRNPEMQKKLNLKIKHRESFRPFAPAVLAEDASDYFQLNSSSPYMLFVQNIQDHKKNELPEGYHNFDLKEKLYFLRSDLPAVTHIDFSARIQTVHQDTNPSFYDLISEFKKLTGCSVLVNTSFNVRGEPIVASPEDAYRCFMRTEMDYLVIEGYLFRKESQPTWQEKENWQEQYILD